MTIEHALPHHLKAPFYRVKSLLQSVTKRAYLVGGGVRDMMLGVPLHDLDIEVYDVSEADFARLMQNLGAIGVGKSFFVYKYGDVDLSLPRIERKVGKGHKAFDVQVCHDEKQAAKRRDFTMNAMMLNIFTQELLDFYGGRSSLLHRQISLVDATSFKEDSLRVLRGIQFSARLGYKIDKETLRVMDALALDDLSKTRIFWELEKLFNAKYLHYGLYYLIKLGIFEKLFKMDFKKDTFLKMALEMARNRKNFLPKQNTYYFMYFIGNIGKIDIKTMIKDLDMPREYRHVFKYQPYIEGDVSDAKLKEIAIDLPISLWLGNYKKGVIARAKRLDIFDKVFDGGITTQSVIADGFEKEAIKKELKRRKLEVIQSE
ncbi:CCA tRNA nucleotidyltransferase [Sulfurospirillum sp. 1612]|uniref:CCA tRNA nucleotidyltransferase n=1 Tax=Sulfurospirillum sp. 1612 TaxID=3094835 RepID=UPI002F942D82